MLERLDIDQLEDDGDILETLRELKLEQTDAPLVLLAEVLLEKLRLSTSPTGTAQIGAQLLNVLRELGATPASRGATVPESNLLNSFKTG